MCACLSQFMFVNGSKREKAKDNFRIDERFQTAFKDR